MLAARPFASAVETLDDTALPASTSQGSTGLCIDTRRGVAQRAWAQWRAGLGRGVAPARLPAQASAAPPRSPLTQDSSAVSRGCRQSGATADALLLRDDAGWPPAGPCGAAGGTSERQDPGSQPGLHPRQLGAAAHAVPQDASTAEHTIQALTRHAPGPAAGEKTAVGANAREWRSHAAAAAGEGAGMADRNSRQGPRDPRPQYTCRAVLERDTGTASPERFRLLGQGCAASNMQLCQVLTRTRCGMRL